MTYTEYKKRGVLNPCIDPTFKSLFTANTPESRGALKSFLEAVLCRKVSGIVLQPNELPTESPFEKQSQFDITCVLDGKEPVNIEMQNVNRKESFAKRAEYNAAHLMNHYAGKGGEWEDMPKCFQISVLNFIFDKDSPGAVNHYTMRTKDGRELHSRLNIYFLELPKLKKMKNIPAEQLTSVERWIKFFLYATGEDNTVIENLSSLEDGIMQAKTALDTLSQDELNWQLEWAEIKRTKDEASLKGAGRREGLAEGLAQGRAEGLAEGLTQGKLESAVNLYKNGVSFGLIEKCTGVTKEQIFHEPEKR